MCQGAVPQKALTLSRVRDSELVIKLKTTILLLDMFLPYCDRGRIKLAREASAFNAFGLHSPLFTDTASILPGTIVIFQKGI